MTSTNDTAAPVARPADAAPARRKGLVLLVTCAVFFLDALDNSTVGVALPSIRDDLSMGTASLQWLVSGYTLAYGGFLLVGGRAADILGRRRVLLVGLAVFVGASLLGGMMTEPGPLIASRFVKGVAAAFTAPAAFSIITTRFAEGRERNRALSIYGATGGLGWCTGLVASGLLTDVDWRLVFFVPGVVGLLVLALVPLAVEPDEPAPAGAGRRSYDPGGALVVTAALLLFVTAVVRAPDAGWSAPSTLLPLALSPLLLWLFVAIERRHHAPMLALDIFSSRTRSASYLVALTHAAAALGWQFAVVLYLQEVLDYGPARIAMAILPLGVTVFLVARFVTSRLVDAYGIRFVCALGLVVQAVAVGLFAVLGEDDRYLTLVLPCLLAHGFACGTVLSAANIGGVSAVADERQGVAAGLSSSAYAVGAGLGTAVLAGVIAATTGDADATPLAAFRNAFLGASALAVVGLGIALLGLPRRDRTS
ncbi:MFS transporter [Streptomyces millisiae]|uniref:MFS transporter n=1 Tax=Streptomyces millisiae TaxID=3075542 RepID=A0ABU2LMW4_9ACTN|nr:MFS transporter [Streptomyces sp. DSM 44918]MDT0318403.1 MFS transporter [Streptomyces sp. DSM 44918]